MFNRFKKILAAALSAAMIVTLIPSTALTANAAEGVLDKSNTVNFSVSSEDEISTDDIETASTTDESVDVGSTITLIGTSGYYKDSWSTSDKDIATVSGSGSTATVKGVKAGTVTITHTYYTENKKKDSCKKTETFTVTVYQTVTVYLTGKNLSSYGYSYSSSDWLEIGTFKTSSSLSTCSWTSINSSITNYLTSEYSFTRTANDSEFSTEYLINTASEYEITEKGTHLDLKLPEDTSETVKVAVYATTGSLDTTNTNTEFESLLGLTYQQPDGYYPIGVIELPKSLFTTSSTGVYINTESDWANVYAALKNIDTSYLSGSGLGNSGNTVSANLSYVQENLGGYAGSALTALFDWNRAEAQNAISLVSGQYYKYHLDIRFTTKALSVVGVYQDGSAENVELASYPYIKDSKSSESDISNLKTIDGYTIGTKYYTDKECTIEYTFGTAVSEDTTIYVKLIKNGYTVNKYDAENNLIESDSYEATSGTTVSYDTLTDDQKNLDGYTVKESSDNSITVGSSDDSTINIYYYKNVTLTANSDTVTYDGSQHEVSGYTVTSGVVSGKDCTFTGITASGKGTTVGSYDVSFNSSAKGTVSDDGYYIVATVIPGTLTINHNNAEITVTTTGGTYTYDGKAHGATVEVTGLPSGYTLKEATSSASVTHVSDGTVTATCDTLVIEDAAGNVVDNDELNIKYVNGTISITAREITVHTASDEMVYNGKTLTANTISKSKGNYVENLAGSETVGLTVTGSQKKAGSSKNTYTLTFKASGNSYTAVESDYTVKEDLGTLTVKNSSDEIVVTIKGGEFTYDGTSHTATIEVGELPDGYTYDEEASSVTGSVTDVDDGTVTPTYTVVIRDADGNDVTSELNITYNTDNSTLSVAPATIVVTTPDAEKTYDGTALTAEGTYSGLVNGETVTFTTTGTQTSVGESKNTYSLVFDGTAKESNYTIDATIGTLKVNEYAGTITVKTTIDTSAATDPTIDTTTGGTNITIVYDGNTYTGTVTVEGLPEGYTVETATSNTSVTHVTDGAVSYTCDNLVIKNAEGEDVTSKLNIEEIGGTITITPATITVVTASDEKTYDGTPLTKTDGYTFTGLVNNETAGFEVTGSRTSVGSSTNDYAITFAAEDNEYTALESDYTVTATKGTLTVNEYAGTIVVTGTGTIPTSSDSTTDTDSESTEDGNTSTDSTSNTGATVSGNNTSYVYDGTAHGATISVSTLPTGYTLETATTTTTVTNVNEGTKQITVDELVIRNAQGVDVTDQLNIDYNLGTITVTARPVTVTTATGSKTYDGTAIVGSDLTGSSVEGIVDGESYGFEVTGTQTKVGSSENTYTLTFAAEGNSYTALASNYSVSSNIGKLTVTENSDEIVVTTTGGTYSYDGKAHGATVTVSELPTGYTLKEATSSATATHVSEGVVNATCDNLIILNADGEDVTKSLNITYEDGTIEITPLALTITTSPVSKAYDGIALTATSEDVTVTGLLDGETVAYSIVGDITNAGSGTYTVDLLFADTVDESYEGTKPTANSSDYTYSTATGSLTVEKRKVILTSATTSKAYDGTALTDSTITVTGDGWATGEGATYDVTGSVTNTSDGSTSYGVNSFTYTLNNGTDANNYEITTVEGQLTITNRGTDEDALYEVSITANSGSKTYDGTALTVSGFVGQDSDGKIAVIAANGITYYVSGLTSEATGTNVVDSVAEIPVSGTVKVEDADGNDVTAQFTVTVNKGSLTINKREVTLTPTPIEVEYDGTAHTAGGDVVVTGDGFVSGEGVTATVSGSQTTVAIGTSEITSYVANDGTDLDNYDVTLEKGTINVTNRSEDTKYKITVTPYSGVTTYNGNTQSISGIYDVSYTESSNAVVSFIKNLLNSNDEIEVVGDSANGIEFTVNGVSFYLSGLTAEASGTNAGEYAVNVTGTAKIVDADGNDVTDQFKVSIGTGTLVIKQRNVTLTSASAAKKYDGTALTANEIAVTGDGFVEGQEPTYTYTGSQTLEGQSENTFTYDLLDSLASNYNIKTIFGTLTVDENIHSIVIHYVDSNGNTVAADYTGTFATGHDASFVVPTIDGYTASNSIIYVLGEDNIDRDLELTVVYTANATTSDTSDDTTTSSSTTSSTNTTTSTTDTATLVTNATGATATPVVTGNVVAVDDVTAIEDDETPLAGRVVLDDDGDATIIDIEDEDVALAGSEEVWALLNLIALIITAIIAIILLILALKKNDKDDEDEDDEKTETVNADEDEDTQKETKRRRILKLLGLVPAIISLIAFILTEDMSNPMALTDKWTVLMLILLAIEVVLAILSKKKKEDKEDEQTEQA